MKEVNKKGLHSFKRIDKNNDGNRRSNQAAENVKQAWRVAESLTLNRGPSSLASLQGSRCLQRQSSIL